MDGKEESTVRDVMVIAANQAVSSRETDDVGIVFSSEAEAKHANDVRKSEEVDTSQTRYGGILSLLILRERSRNYRNHASKVTFVQSHRRRAADVGVGISLTERMTLDSAFSMIDGAPRRRAVPNCQHIQASRVQKSKNTAASPLFNSIARLFNLVTSSNF